MVTKDTYRSGVTVFRCKWFENIHGAGYRVNGPGQKIGAPELVEGQPPRRPPHRRRELEVILDFDAVTPAMIADWCDRQILRQPMIRLLVSPHRLEADRRRGLALQFAHPLDARAFSIDFRPYLTAEEW